MFKFSLIGSSIAKAHLTFSFNYKVWKKIFMKPGMSSLATDISRISVSSGR